MTQYCLLLVLSAQGGTLSSPELQTKINFQSVAAPATKVVQALAKQTKLKLSASAKHSVDIVYVHATDVPASEIMSRIATVTSSEWQRTGSEYRLVRKAATEKQEAQTELKERLSRYQDALKLELEKAAPKPPIPMSGADSAFRRIVPTLIAQIGLRDLVKLEPGQRLVYSSTPNRMQLPLGRSYDEVLSMVVENFNRYRSGRQIEQTVDSLTTVLDRYVGTDQEKGPSKSKPEVLLVAQRFSSELRFDCQTFNARDRATMFARISLSDLGASLAGRRPLPGELKEPDAEIKLTGPIKEVSDWFASSAMVPSKDAWDLYAKPDEAEPYGLECSSIFNQVADCRKINIVANLPDEVTPVGNNWGKLPKTINEWLAKLAVHPRVRTTFEAGWLEVRPDAQVATRDGRINRAALARLLQSCRGTGSARLNDIAEYALAVPSQSKNWLCVPSLLMYCPNVLVMGDKLNDWDMLLLYASLETRRRETIYNGGSISFERITPSQRAALERLIYSQETADALARLSMVTVPAMGSIPERLVQTRQGEPTELFPDGPPAALVLHSRVTEDFAAAYPPSHVDYRSGSVSADTLGFFLAASDSRDAGDRSQVNVALGTRRKIECEIPLLPGFSLRKSLGDDIYEPGAKHRSWTDLPDEFRRAVDKAVLTAAERRSQRPLPPVRPPD